MAKLISSNICLLVPNMPSIIVLILTICCWYHVVATCVCHWGVARHYQENCCTNQKFTQLSTKPLNDLSESCCQPRHVNQSFLLCACQTIIWRCSTSWSCVEPKVLKFCVQNQKRLAGDCHSNSYYQLFEITHQPHCQT